jgi:hypothetical protein
MEGRAPAAPRVRGHGIHRTKRYGLMCHELTTTSLYVYDQAARGLWTHGFIQQSTRICMCVCVCVLYIWAGSIRQGEVTSGSGIFPAFCGIRCAFTFTV